MKKKIIVFFCSHIKPFYDFFIKRVKNKKIRNMLKIEIMKRAVLFIGMVFFAMCLNINAQKATPRVTQKQINQQARIHQGVKSGELTRREAVRLEAQQAKIQHKKRVAKADGVVTPRERVDIRTDQRQANRTIRRNKNDEQKRF
jgi:hypothetical protein